MKPLNILHCVILLALLSCASAPAQHVSGGKAGMLDRAQSALAKESAAFIENHGQWNPEARFLARFNGLDLWVTNHGITYDLYKLDGRAAAAPRAAGDGADAPASRVGHVVRMNFIGAGQSAAEGVEALPGTYSYFIGNDQSKWTVGVPRYSQARINHLYKGVDAAIYFDNGQPRYDILLSPGADPSAIHVSYDGSTGLTVNRKGELVISTPLGDLKQQGLYAYQIVGGTKKEVHCAFRMEHGNHVGFSLGTYDHSAPVVIDPLLFGTYISTNGYSRGLDVALDANQNVYVTGFTGFVNYPTSQGAYQTVLTGDATDVVVTKLDSTGTKLLYSTFLGGGNDDIGNAIAVDGNGMIYVTGYTTSRDFPTQNAYDNTIDSLRDVFVAKLDPSQLTPQAQLVYSTFVGGHGVDYGNGIAVRNGMAYVTGYTNSTTFPTVTPFQATAGIAPGGAVPGDAFVLRLSPDGTTLQASTYLGGASNIETGNDVAVDNAGNVYVCGQTHSTDFPTNGSSPGYDASANGGNDAFVAKLNPALSALLYGTYMGGSGEDRAYGLVVDGAGNAYVTGMAASGFPTTQGAYKTAYNGGNNDIFVAKFNPTGLLLYSTYIGGNNDEWANDIAIDPSGNAYITGVTRAQNFPVTSNAIQPVLNGGDFDAFIAEVNPGGTGLLYSTYMGGSTGDTAMGIAVSTSGYIHVAGTSFSNNFPTTKNSYLPNGVGGIFVAKIGIMKMTYPSGGEVLCAGENIHITWGGVDPNNAYDLYISADSGRTFSPIAFNIYSSSFDWVIPISFQASNEYRIKVISSSSVESDLSNRITINTPPTITAQPVSVTTAVGGSATFVAAATATPDATVQWQSNSGGGWNSIAGANTNVLKLTNVTAAQNGTLYHAVFANSCRVVATDSAMLTVPSLLVDTPNGGESFCAGTRQTIAWTTATDAASVNILLSTDGGVTYTPIANNVSGSTYSWNIPPALSGSRFRIQVQSGSSQAQDVSNGNFEIHLKASVTKQPASTTVVMGDNASFTAEGHGFPEPAITWEVNDGTAWTPVDNATTATLTLTNVDLSHNGYHYRAIFTNDCGSDTTAAAALAVTHELEGVDEDAAAARAMNLTLLPNPVGGSAEIRYRLPRAGHAELHIVDMAGRTVARPLDAQMSGGDHHAMFDASALPPGSYTCVLVFGRTQSTAKMTVVR